MSTPSNIDKLIGLALGAAFGARVLDERKPIWARAAYGAVAADLISSALATGAPVFGKAPFGPQQSAAGKAAGGKPGTPLNFEERRVKTIEQRVAFVHEQAVKGTRDPVVYSLAREILSRQDANGNWKVREKDNWGEVQALFWEVRKRVRYTWDPTDYDAFQTPRKTLALKAGDCVPATALVLTAGYQLKPIGEVREGDLVMGDGQWTRVTKFWDKGEKKVLSFKLNNGCVLRCTPDHKLFVVRRKHAGKGGTGSRENVIEVHAKNVRVGDDLLTPESLPAGREALDFEKAWLLGTFIADGWTEDYRCAISGKDGHPKEAQKRRVEAYCKANGIETRWAERYISINDKNLTAWLSAAGRGAFNKHVPSLDLDEVAVAGILKGLEADAGRTKNGTLVYSTISQTLALQLRVMLRMQGKSCHIVKVEKHGGLGENPIYRVTVRGEKNRKPHARVEAVEDAGREHVVDIETDTHRFYLPESDVVVHNCDDQVALLAALLRSVGYKVRSRIVQTKGESNWNHIYLATEVPGKGWVPLDPTVAQPPGWEVPKEFVIQKQDFAMQEAGGAPKVKTR